jgi:hypothetical protein
MIVELTGMKRWLAFSGLETSQIPNTRPTGGYQLSPRGYYPFFPSAQAGGKGLQTRLYFTAKHIKSKGLR